MPRAAAAAPRQPERPAGRIGYDSQFWILEYLTLPRRLCPRRGAAQGAHYPLSGHAARDHDIFTGGKPLSLIFDSLLQVITCASHGARASASVCPSRVRVTPGPGPLFPSQTLSPSHDPSHAQHYYAPRLPLARNIPAGAPSGLPGPGPTGNLTACRNGRRVKPTGPGGCQSWSWLAECMNRS